MYVLKYAGWIIIKTIKNLISIIFWQFGTMALFEAIEKLYIIQQVD